MLTTIWTTMICSLRRTEYQLDSLVCSNRRSIGELKMMAFRLPSLNSFHLIPNIPRMARPQISYYLMFKATPLRHLCLLIHLLLRGYHNQ